MSIDLQALKTAIEAATPLPWTWLDARTLTHVEQDGTGIPICSVPKRSTPDAALIVAAVNALPLLIAELEAARKDTERYRWLRNQQWDEDHPVWEALCGLPTAGAPLDEAIDAAKGSA